MRLSHFHNKIEAAHFSHAKIPSFVYITNNDFQSSRKSFLLLTIRLPEIFFVHLVRFLLLSRVCCSEVEELARFIRLHAANFRLRGATEQQEWSLAFTSFSLGNFAASGSDSSFSSASANAPKANYSTFPQIHPPWTLKELSTAISISDIIKTK